MWCLELTWFLNSFKLTVQLQLLQSTFSDVFGSKSSRLVSRRTAALFFSSRIVAANVSCGAWNNMFGIVIILSA